MSEWGHYAHPEEDLMKPNEWVLTILQVAAPVFCFAVGLIWQGVFLTVWLVLFGLTEYFLKVATGKTLSQHVWTKPKWVRIVLSALMVAGMLALGYHFIWG
jgi:hypothetical protein